MSDAFLALANLLMVATVTIYFRGVVKGTTTPNTATWLISAVVMTMNTITYLTVVDGDLKKAAIGAVVNLGILAIFGYSLFKGKFANLGRLDAVMLALACLIGTVWRNTGNAIIANLALQAVLFISFIPTVVGLLRGELRDNILPWSLAVIAYTFQILAILTAKADWTWPEIVYPILNGIMGNGSVIAAILWTKRARAEEAARAATDT